MAEQRINLNTATVEELMQLPGIGPVLAQRVVTYRDTVESFDEPAAITAVSGIGERGYEAIADRVTVAPPEEGGPSLSGESRAGAADSSVSDAPSAEEDEESDVETGLAPEEQAAPEEEAETEIQTVPPGESFSEEPLRLEQELSDEEMEVGAAKAEEPATETTEEAAPVVQEEPTEEAPPEPGEEPAEEDVATEPEKEEPSEEEPAEEGLAAALTPPQREPAHSVSWWRRLSWLWTALLGGLLGMIFALIVWSGINGSLDVGHSPAVLTIRSDLDALATDVGTLETSVNGLRQRLEALEGLTTRMDKIETSVSDLREETSQLSEQAEVLEDEISTVSEELQTVSEDVAALQREAERTQSFFSGLQTLLDDVFSEGEGTSTPTPTPTPEGK